MQPLKKIKTIELESVIQKNEVSKFFDDDAVLEVKIVRTPSNKFKLFLTFETEAVLGLSESNHER